MIQIILSSAAMGDVTEADFDAWASYVAEHLPREIAGEEFDVDQMAFPSVGEDRVSGATEEQWDSIRRWLSVDGWEAFCADAPAKA